MKARDYIIPVLGSRDPLLWFVGQPAYSTDELQAQEETQKK